MYNTRSTLLSAIRLCSQVFFNASLSSANKFNLISTHLSSFPTADSMHKHQYKKGPTSPRRQRSGNLANFMKGAFVRSSKHKSPTPSQYSSMGAGPSRHQTQQPHAMERRTSSQEGEEALHGLYKRFIGKRVPRHLLQFPLRIFHRLVHGAKASELDDAITQGDLRRATKSFSAVEWVDICNIYNLDSTKGHNQFSYRPICGVTLPSDIQETIFNHLFLSIATNGPPISHSKERQHEPLITPVLSTCLSFFGNILRNEAECNISGDQTSTGGCIEVVIRTTASAVVVFIELKQRFLSLYQGGPPLKVLAQAAVEMSGAHSLNKKMGLDFPVFGVVTDLCNFFYYAFNGSEFSRLGSLDGTQAASYEVLGELSDDLYTATSLLSAFTIDLFALLLHGVECYCEAMVERLKLPNSLVVASGKAAATTTPRYQAEIFETFRVQVSCSKKRMSRQQIAVGIAHAVLCHSGFIWNNDDSLVNKSKKLNPSQINIEGRQLFPMRYQLEDSNLQFCFAALRLEDESGEVIFSLKSERAAGVAEIAVLAYCETNDLPKSLDLCFTADDGGSEFVILKVLELIRQFLSKATIFAAPVTSNELLAWKSALDAVQVARKALRLPASDADCRNTLNGLSEKLSVLGPRGIHDQLVYQRKRRDQIRKNEVHCRYRNQEFWEMGNSDVAT